MESYNEEVNMGINKPELGIYDDRAWQALYKRHINNQGPHPGKHPDPNCIWNTNEDMFRRDDYDQDQKNLRKEA